MTTGPSLGTTGTQDSEALSISAAPASRKAFWFAAGLVAFQVFALAFSLWASAQPWFFYHAADPLLENFGYSHRAYGMRCDILISGDSTALADFVPSVIEQRTGLKTCNVSEMRSIQDFVGTHYTIDDYLAHNPAPRFIVTGWTPSDFNLEHPPLLSTQPDSYAYAMQNHRDVWLWKAMLARPKPALAFVTWAESALLEDTAERLFGLHGKQSKMDERARRSAMQGMYYVPAPAQTSCIDDRDLKFRPSTYEQNAASVAAFRRHYETPSTHVLIYATPVADCDGAFEQYAALTRGLTDKPLEHLPIDNFNLANIHLKPESAAIYSAAIADDILARMGTSSGTEQASEMPR